MFSPLINIQFYLAFHPNTVNGYSDYIDVLNKSACLNF